MGVMLQSFYWDCPRLAGVEFGWWRYLTARLDIVRDAGFTSNTPKRTIPSSPGTATIVIT